MVLVEVAVLAEHRVYKVLEVVVVHQELLEVVEHQAHREVVV